MFWLQRLSIVRIFFLRASQAKTRTLGGALIFHRDDQLPEGAEAIDKEDKKEDTKKLPLREGAQNLLSFLAKMQSMLGLQKTISSIFQWHEMQHFLPFAHLERSS